MSEFEEQIDDILGTILGMSEGQLCFECKETWDLCYCGDEGE